MTTAHRVVAWVMGSAALFACAIIADIHNRVALSTAGIAIAAVTYVSFTVIAIRRWPAWLLVAVSTAGAAAGPRDFEEAVRRDALAALATQR